MYFNVQFLAFSSSAVDRVPSARGQDAVVMELLVAHGNAAFLDTRKSQGGDRGTLGSHPNPMDGFDRPGRARITKVRYYS